MVMHAQIIPAQLELSVGNATGIEELSDAELASRAATYTCRTTSLFPVSGNCSSYYLCQLSPSGQMRAVKRTCYPNNYNPFFKQCSSQVLNVYCRMFAVLAVPFASQILHTQYVTQKKSRCVLNCGHWDLCLTTNVIVLVLVSY
jgi:hypothetical protein